MAKGQSSPQAREPRFSPLIACEQLRTFTAFQNWPDHSSFLEMSRFAREELLLVDWRTVRMLSIDGAIVHIVTEKDGPRFFKFDSETEARAALDEWMLGSQIDEQ